MNPVVSSRVRASARLLALALAALPSLALAQTSAHSWDRPFSRTSSPWNVPIGANATYGSTGFGTLGATRIDVEYLERSSVLDPSVAIYNPGNTSATYFSLRLPPGFSTLTPAQGFTPNNGTNFLDTDALNLISTNYLHYRTDLSKWLGWNAGAERGNIFGPGTRNFNAAHSGAYLPVIGGSIRPGELTNNPTAVDTIRHALNLEVDWAVMYKAASLSGAYVWPAAHADEPGWQSYGGTNPNVKMGALLAIPRKNPNNPADDYDPTDLGIVTAPGKKIFWTLQNFGGYLVDTSGPFYFTNGGYTMNIGAEASVPAAFQAAYGTGIENWGRTTDWGKDMDKIYRALRVVTNQSETNISGGGTRPTGVAPKPINYVKNPDFEQDQGVTQSIAGWSSVGDLAADQTSTYLTAKSGNYYLVHTGTAAYSITTRQDFTGLPAGNYRAAVWVQSTGGHTEATLFSWVKQSNGTFAYGNGVSVPTGAVGTWTKITTPAFYVGYGEAGIRLKTITGANNSVRWDDAEFYRE